MASPTRRFFRFPWRSRGQIVREIDEELAFHLDMRAAELRRAGASEEEAWRRARTGFGDLDYTRDYCHGQDRDAERRSRLRDRLTELGQDIGYALRGLRRSPGFALVAVATLALAIGANTAMFGVARAVLLRPLPYGEPDRLVALSEHNLSDRTDGVPLSVPEYLDYRERQHTLTDLGAYMPGSVTWRPADGDPEILPVQTVTVSLFPVLQVRPLLGRIFAEGEDVPWQPLKAVVSHDFWRDRLGGDPAVIGRTITLNNEAVPIIGVMPEGFTLGSGEALWIPIDNRAALYDKVRSRKQHYLGVIGRLRPGVELAGAEQDLLSVARRLEQEEPAAGIGHLTSLHPLRAAMTGTLRPQLLLLQGAAILVLLIACANLANVTLARTMGRRRELAVRASLGAGRGRLARQLLTESCLLALAGGVVGLGLAAVVTRVLLALHPEVLPPAFRQVTPDRDVLFFTLGLSLLTGVLFGLIPALTGTRAELATALKEGPGRGGRSSQSMRRTLIVAQVGTAALLLVGAGVLLRSFAALTQVPLGFTTESVLTARLSTPGARYDSAATTNRFYDSVLEEMARTPGVIAVGAVNNLPLSGNGATLLYVEGAPASADPPSIGYASVRGDYFATIGLSLVAGRLYDARDDTPGAPATILVNKAAAARHFPEGGALGHRIRLGPGNDGPWHTIIGIIGDARTQRVDLPSQPTVFANHRHATWLRSMVVVIRTTGAPEAMIAPLRHAVGAADPTLGIRQIRRLDTVLDGVLAPRRFATTLVAGFAGLALLLAAIGIYGVLAFGVTARTREFGVRLALGANRRSVVGLVLRQGLGWSLPGLLLGLGGAFAARRLIGGMIYGVTATDPVTYLAVAGGIAVVVLLACLMPARRAMRVDPVTSMRAE